ncbi:MAG: PKD domain-containing protein [Bacteroidales bacterium]|nr:PKD domain-containing protein [Bacteroidales bacterium]
MKRHVFLVMACLAAAISCTQTAEPVQYEIPVVRFPYQEDVVDAMVGEEVTFDAEIVSGEKVTCTWSVDGIVEASSQTFVYVFDAPGEYSVSFEAHNGSGKVEKSYTVIVSDVFKVRLSVGDSVSVTRKQLNSLNVAAIVDYGTSVSHEWRIAKVGTGTSGESGEIVSTEAFCGHVLEEVAEYRVSYKGWNPVGEFSGSFIVNVEERPLEMAYSIYDLALTVKKREVVTITATALYGGTGLEHSWSVNGEELGTEPTFSWSADEGGLFIITYTGKNAKGETASRSWSVTVLSFSYMLDDFETGTSLNGWWTLGQNSPGIELVDNPDPSGINKSSKCMKDSVAGTGGTSGYFDLKGSVIKAAGVDLTLYNSIRIKVHLGKNRYYPRIQVSGKKYAPVTPPKFEDCWEELLFKFPENFTAEQTITFRPLLKEDGSNIASGAVTDTNTRSVYIDDIEFLD